MEGNILAALIAASSVLLTVLLKHLLTRRTTRRRDDRVTDLQQRLRDVLDDQADQSNRKVSYQLAVIDEKIADLRACGSSVHLSVLGINAIGPLHQGREIILDILKHRGAVRVLLLDPDRGREVLQWRCELENDAVGRISAELYASFHILMDIVHQVGGPHSPPARRLEIRLHDRRPDRSLIMVNCEDTDGIVLENPYLDLRGKRGTDQEMFKQVQRRGTAAGYKDNVRYYEGLWRRAPPVQLLPVGQRPVPEWPYRYLAAQ